MSHSAALRDGGLGRQVVRLATTLSVLPDGALSLHPSEKYLKMVPFSNTNYAKTENEL